MSDYDKCLISDKSAEIFGQRAKEYKRLLYCRLKSVREDPNRYDVRIQEACKKTDNEFGKEFARYRYKLLHYRRLVIAMFRRVEDYKENWHQCAKIMDMSVQDLRDYLDQRLLIPKLPLSGYLDALGDEFYETLEFRFRSSGVVEFERYSPKQTCEGKKLQVWGMSGAFFNPPGVEEGNNSMNDQFLKEIENWADNIPFIPDVELGLPGKGRHLYVESSLKSGIFTFSNGNVVIPTQPATDTGLKIINWVNENFYQIKQNAIEKYCNEERNDAEYSYVQMKVNTLQCNLGSCHSGYGIHDDRGPENCIKPNQLDEAKSALAKILPSQDEMDVVTLVFVFNRLHDGPSGYCNLIHLPNEGGPRPRGGKQSIVTKFQSLHYQGPGLQTHTKHKIESCKIATRDGKKKVPDESNGMRMVISCRMSADFDDNRKEMVEAVRHHTNSRNFDPATDIKKNLKMYKHVLSNPDKPTLVEEGLCSHCGGGKFVPEKGAATNKLGTEKACEKNNKKKGGRVSVGSKLPQPGMRSWPTWRNASYVNLPRPGTKMEIPQAAHQVVRGFFLTRKLIALGKFLQVLEPGDNTIAQQTWGYLKTIHAPGDIFSTEKIRSSNHILNTAKQCRIANSQKELTDTMVLERWYKNDADTIAEVMRHLRNGDIDYLYNRGEEELIIWVTAEGGNSTVQGSIAPPKLDDPNKETTVYSETWQSQGTLVQALNECVLTDTVTQLYVPDDWDSTEGKIDDHGNKRGKVMCLGLWYLDSMVLGRHNAFYDESNINTTWAREKSWVYYLRPLWNTANPVPANVEFGKLLEPFVIKTNEPRISCWLPPSGRDIPRHNSEWVQEQWWTEKLEFGEQVTQAEEEEDDNDNEDKDNYREDLLSSNLIDRSYQIDMDQMVHEMERLSVACSARTLRMHVNESDGSAGILAGKPFLRLGWLHGLVPIPNPIRTYNAQTWTFVESQAKLLQAPLPNDGCTKYQRYLRRGMPPQAFMNNIYAAIVLRTTGNPTLFVEFAKTQGDLGGRLTKLPTMEQHEKFKSFLIGQSGGPDNKMSKCAEVLYARSHLASSKSTVKVYLNFLDKVYNALKTAEEMRRQWKLGSKNTWTYNDWLRNIEDVLRTSDGDQGIGRPAFLASLVLLDLEEIVELDFPGRDDSLLLGVGGERGLGLIARETGQSPLDVAKMIIHHLRNDASNSSLAIMGLYRNNVSGENKVMVLLNNREIWIQDVDNILCKLNLSQVYTTGSRRVSICPKFYRYYDMPLPVKDHKKPDIDCPVLCKICQNALDQYAASSDDTSKTPHKQFQFYNEGELWAAICKDFDDGKIYLSDNSLSKRKSAPVIRTVLV